MNDENDNNEEKKNEDEILTCWQQNVAPWTQAVREQRIVSRRDITDAAILEAIFSEPFDTALDIGCGEGWLTRAMGRRGVRAVGVDAVAGLVEKAAGHEDGCGVYRCLSYEDLARGKLPLRFDLAVCNFSLLGKDSVEELIAAAPDLLQARGRLIIQTLNPRNPSDADYRDGWRAGSWQGFSADFVNPAPWYYRTLESWQTLLSKANLKLEQTIEPRHPQNGQLASIIFIARKR